MTQSNLDLTTEKKTGPVECLGQTFESDEARRAHYIELLREKLKDLEFRKIEGFPIGEDEDILNLSDPPYYTACPNPWIGDFITHYGKPYDPKVKYHREPFAADVSEGKNHPIYNAHSYHTKVPHRAIMRYILHYTEPGDVVFDGFCGTGMTGVAAQLCGDEKEVRELGYRVDGDGTIYNEEGKAFSKLGARRAVLNDLSPAATFIAYNYNTPVDVDAFEKEAKRILDEVEAECGWMYETKHTDGSVGKIHCIVWSDVFTCSECGSDIIYWDAAIDSKKGAVNDEFPCASCGAIHSKKRATNKISSFFDKFIGKVVKNGVQVPVLISYECKGKRFQKTPDQDDLNLLLQIESKDFHLVIPCDRMMHASDDVEKWGDRWRAGSASFTHIHHIFTQRNLVWLASLGNKVKKTRYQFLLTAIVNRSSRMNRIHLKNFFHGGGGWNAGYMKGAIYLPSLPIETSVSEQWKDRLKSTVRAFQVVSSQHNSLIGACPKAARRSD